MSGSTIKKLEIQGFKSFPERTKVLFHSGITAIVGPNGTGKSNIVDALLWVLGGQRPRSLRGEKIDNIIFNGNIKKAPLGMADVTISLNDPQEEQEEMVVSHRAFRSGESEYRLNGKLVRLKDIQDELWKRSIGEKEYFVIEQGTIGQFVTSKPTEKRLLLEEAAGTAFYKDKKRQAENKLETSEQNLVRLEDIIEEIGRAKNSLQRQAQAANRYRKLRERVRELTALHYRRKLFQLEHSQAEASGQFHDFTVREKEALARLAAEEKELARTRREFWDLEKALKLDQEALFGLRAQVTRLESEAGSEQKRLGFFEERRSRARRDIEERRQEMEQQNKEETESAGQAEGLGRELARIKEAGEAAELKMKDLQTRLEGGTRELEEMRRRHLEVMSALTGHKNDQAKLEKEKELILRQETKLSEKLTSVRARFEEQEARVRQGQAEKDSLSERIQSAEQETAGAGSQREACRREAEALQAEAERLKAQKNEASFHLQALKKLLEARPSPESGLLPDGSPGRLADLIEADSETAGLLDILWKEEAGAPVLSAEDLLKGLEARGLRGRFLLLPSSSDQEKRHPGADEPEVLGRLKLRLKVRPDVSGRLTRLPDAALVRDLKTAVSLWLRHPEGAYLTLGGDLLTPSGLLRAGSKEEGAFTLHREARGLQENLERLEQELSPVLARLEEKQKEQLRLEDKLAACRSELEELGRRIQEAERRQMLDQAEKEKAGDDLALLEKEMAILLSDRQSLEPRVMDIGRRVAALDEEDGSLKIKIESGENGLRLSRQQSGQAEKLFFEIQGSRQVLQEKLRSLERQSRSLGLRREATRTRILAAEEEIRSSNEEEARSRENIRRLEAEAAERESERLEKENRVGQEEIRLAELRKQQEQLEERASGLRRAVEALQEDRVKKEVGKAEVERDLINLEETCWQELKKTLAEVKVEIPAERLGGSEVEEELEQAKEDLLKYKAVNLMAEEEYQAQKERFDFLVKQRDDLRASISDTKEAIHKIDVESETMFLTALAEVNRNFQQVFNLLFNGGTAEVKLTEPESPMDSGVDIAAQPPGKKLQSLTLLSGGEKSLTSLAFLFALFRYRPTPFCLLDEVDAALDEVNLARFLELMKKLKTETQFIIVTHNYKTMEVADYIYGTTMSEPNITSIYSVKLEKKEEALQAKDS
ncbi:MAG: chromosome segregation protein SMC [Candidatus Aminicenantales bacterium]